MLDPDGRIATWNAGAQHILGYRPSEVIGKYFAMLYPRPDAAGGMPERELAVASEEGRYEEEGWRMRKDGSLFWASVVLTAVHDPSTGELRGFAKVTRDLTERRRMELEARQSAEETARERARTVEAQRALKQRDEFISVASHELRTPLTALHLKVEGVTQALAKATSGAVNVDLAQHAARLEGALRQVDRLGVLVERLLDVSRIAQGRLVLNVEELDLATLVAQVVDDFREPARAAGSDLRFRANGQALGAWDRARIEQVVVNLLSNAIKYGAGKPIDVAVEPWGAGFSLRVEDHGIGIAAEDRERIFVRFERAAPSRHYSGLGIGLYVTHSIVEAHGGTIDVDSTTGRGSTFTVHLPARAGVEATRAKHLESHP